MTAENGRDAAPERTVSPFLNLDAARNVHSTLGPGTRESVGLVDSIGMRDIDQAAPTLEAQDQALEEQMAQNGQANFLAGGSRGPENVEMSGYVDGRNGTSTPAEDAVTEKEKPVTWSSLPRKDQLTILTMARLSEPLTQTSLQAYMFYQLKSFDPKLPDSTISSQAGMLQGSFTAAQFVTAILWGRVADAEWGGRKRVLLIGLLGTCISCLGFGFAKSFAQAVVFRAIGGALNGNVGVMRTMIAEIIKEKKYQSRAFLLLPMCFNIGVIIGPVLGGLLADPVTSYPGLFGPGSTFGGKNGVGWMIIFPYALPNLLSAIFLSISAFGVLFGLEETSELRRDKPDWGLQTARYIGSLYRRLFNRPSVQYAALAGDETLDSPSHSRNQSADVEALPVQGKLPETPRIRRKLPVRRIWTRNVLCTLLVHAILSFHVGTFQNLWYVFLSTPRFDPAHPDPPDHHQHLPFNFTGGLGMPPRSVGVAMAILGVIGISLQLLVYPTVNGWLGTLRSYRLSLLFFPVAYTLAPFLAVVPSSSKPPAQATGFFVWVAIAGILVIQVLARTFALPANIILINNCSPHPTVLGTIHGIGQSVSSLMRTLGPVLGGWLYGRGLSHGMVGVVWWTMAIVAVLGCFASGLVYEGSGHEILLEGEEWQGEESVASGESSRTASQRASTEVVGNNMAR